MQRSVLTPNAWFGPAEPHPYGTGQPVFNTGLSQPYRSALTNQYHAPTPPEFMGDGLSNRLQAQQIRMRRGYAATRNGQSVVRNSRVFRAPVQSLNTTYGAGIGSFIKNIAGFAAKHGPTALAIAKDVAPHLQASIAKHRGGNGYLPANRGGAVVMSKSPFKKSVKPTAGHELVAKLLARR